ncbi:MAG: N-acetylmuramoyl-L-alanine amidase, partial [Streptococcaceae bacterium]|nr:N-acetylmuramoyl-L-alanine amidase [Streptococcaceae bacterium]
YTTNKVESDNLTSLPHTDWRYEGIAWQAPVSSSTPVYRVYNPKSGEHLNTKDSNEVKVLTSKYGWRNEGTSFFSDTASGARTAYRLFNPAAGVGAHFVTMDAHEKSVLMTKGWKYEGVAWYGKK